MEDNDNNQIGHHAPPDLSTKPVKGILKKPSKFIQDPASARYVPLDHEQTLPSAHRTHPPTLTLVFDSLRCAVLL